MGDGKVEGCDPAKICGIELMLPAGSVVRRLPEKAGKRIDQRIEQRNRRQTEAFAFGLERRSLVVLGKRVEYEARRPLDAVDCAGEIALAPQEDILMQPEIHAASRKGRGRRLGRGIERVAGRVRYKVQVVRFRVCHCCGSLGKTGKRPSIWSHVHKSEKNSKVFHHVDERKAQTGMGCGTCG